MYNIKVDILYTLLQTNYNHLFTYNNSLYNFIIVYSSQRCTFYSIRIYNKNGNKSVKSRY